MNNNELTHWGIKGMRWGRRRFQNPDGSLTEAGRKRYSDEYEKLSNKKKNLEDKIALEKLKKDIKDQKAALKTAKKEAKGKTDEKKDDKKSEKDKSKNPYDGLSNQELQEKIDRLRLEQTLSSLTPEKKSWASKLIDRFKDKSVETISQSGANLVGDLISKVGGDTIKGKLGKENEELDTALKREELELKKKQNEDEKRGLYKSKEKGLQDAEAILLKRKQDQEAYEESKKASKKKTTSESSKSNKELINEARERAKAADKAIAEAKKLVKASAQKGTESAEDEARAAIARAQKAAKAANQEGVTAIFEGDAWLTALRKKKER